MAQQFRRLFWIVLMVMVSTQIGAAETSSPKIGIVIMHGKGGSPTKHVFELASTLEEKGYLVANLEMPWSGNRGYDVDVSAAEKEVQSALQNLKSKGAQKLIVAGHSQGGVFALYFGSEHIVDGVIAIAPGGNVKSATFQEKLSGYVEKARRLIAEGKGAQKEKFSDFEGARGVFPVTTTAGIYLTWFDPEGAMNQMRSIKHMKTPVLYVAPTDDYPGLRNIKQTMFDALPTHPLNKLYEPNSNHTGAPSISRDEIMRWMSEVTRGK